MFPAPRFPSHRSSPPKLATHCGVAVTSTRPRFTAEMNAGNRLRPCEGTPSALASAYSRLLNSARSPDIPTLMSTRRNVSRSSSYGTRMLTRSGRGRLGEAIQQLLVAAHEPELLARDALLQRGIRLDARLVAPQRIDDVLERVDCRHECGAPSALAHEVARAVLAALHREDQRGKHAHRDQCLLDASGR